MNNYLIWQYRDKPNALSTIKAIYKETASSFKSCLDVINALNIDEATGYALDLVGRHVGMYRDLNQATDKEYFGFSENKSALGFNVGEFYFYGDALSKTVRLGDEDYRFFIKAKILKNYQTPTLSDIHTSINQLFGVNSNIIDNLNMTMKIMINRSALTDLMLYAVKTLDVVNRPVGVEYNYLILTSNKYFGFSEDSSASGFDVGAFVTIEEM